MSAETREWHGFARRSGGRAQPMQVSAQRGPDGATALGTGHDGKTVSADTSNRHEEFESFFRQHWGPLVAAFAFVLPEGEDPEDVAQEALTRAYQHWARVSTHESPEGWLFVTGCRIATGLRRRARVRARKGWLVAAPSSVDPFDSNTQPISLLSTLSTRQRGALLLRHYYGYSTREVARILRCREGTVKSLVARGRAALQDAERGEQE